MSPIRVIVVDDHEIVRAGLGVLLSREPDLHIAGMAESGEEGLRLMDELSPDVAVVDYSLPGMSGVEVCQAAKVRHPQLPVIMLTTYLDDEVIQNSLEAGARAYVYKDVEGRDLKRAIRAVVRGEAVLDPKVAGRVARWAARARKLTGDSVLSARETEVIRLVARGASNLQIAEEMGLSINTIKTYVRRVLEKLECKSRSQAAAVASRRGLL